MIASGDLMDYTIEVTITQSPHKSHIQISKIVQKEFYEPSYSHLMTALDEIISKNCSHKVRVLDRVMESPLMIQIGIALVNGIQLSECTHTALYNLRPL